MKYKDLKHMMNHITPEQLGLDVVVYVDHNDNEEIGEYFPAEFSLGDYNPVLQENHPYIVISGVEEDKLENSNSSYKTFSQQ